MHPNKVKRVLPEREVLLLKSQGLRHEIQNVYFEEPLARVEHSEHCQPLHIHKLKLAIGDQAHVSRNSRFQGNSIDISSPPFDSPHPDFIS